MVVSLPFTVNLYHDGVFHVNPFQYVNSDSKVIDDVSFDDLFTKHIGYGIMEIIAEELHPKNPVSHVDSDSDVETSHPLDDVAHVVEQFEHEDKGNVNIPRMTTDDSWLKKLVESKFKAKKNMSYPSFNLDTP
ncbi:hypothetical protein Tco_1224638 [Tanacetum coccineum]